jgi:hypothetical protein
MWVFLVTEKISEGNSPAIRQQLKLNIRGLKEKKLHIALEVYWYLMFFH